MLIITIFYLSFTNRIIVFANTVMFYTQVGPQVQNKTQAINEMTEVAGIKDRFFQISNYAELENILSSLEKSIIGIEGKPKYL